MDRTVPMAIPPVDFEASDQFLDRLLHPARFFGTPEEVLRDKALDVAEKRAILSSWASDACAIESMPALRKPPGACATVTFDAIMDALRSLDGIPHENSEGYRQSDGTGMISLDV
jgi:hypothetical protein